MSRAPTVELAHEALLREWPRYREWVEATRSDVQFQRRLAAAAAEWRDNDENPGYLLTSPRLAKAEAWRTSTSLVLSEVEERYIADSSARAAEIHRHRRRRRRLISGTISAIAAVALALVVFAITQQSAARRLDAVGEVNRIIEAAEDVVETDPELALLLAAEAAEQTEDLRMDVFPENLEILHQGLRNHRLLFTVPGVRSVVFSPEADIVYAALADGTISLRDATTGAELDIITPGDDGPPLDNRLAITADGRWLTNGRVVIDVMTGEAETLDSPEGRLSVMSVDINDDVIATAHFERGADGRGEPGREVVVWDRATQEELWTRHVPAPIEVDLSPDGSLLAVASAPAPGAGANAVFVYDVATGEETEIPVQELTIGVRFHPSGELLALGGQGVVRYWDVASETFASHTHGGHIGVVEVDFDGDGAVMASVDASGNAILRDAGSGEPLFPLPNHGSVIVQSELSADGSRLATVTTGEFGEPGSIRMFDVTEAGGRDLVTIETRMPLAATVDVDAAGSLIAVGDHVAGAREVWDMSGNRLLELPPHEPFPVPIAINGPVAVSPDGTRLVTGDAAGKIRIWDAATGSLLRSTTTLEMAPALADAYAGGRTIFGLTFSPDGSRIAVTGTGFVLVADAADLSDVQVLLVGPFTAHERAAFSPDGLRVVAGTNRTEVPPPDGFTNPVNVWDVTTGEVIHSIPGGQPGSKAVDYSPGGDLVAVGSTVESTIEILDADDFETLHTLESNSPGVSDIAFDPTGNGELAAAYGDGTIVIWDAGHGVPLYDLPGHDGGAADLDWTADGGRLVSVGFDGTVRVFAMDAGELLELARRRVNRSLSDQECRQYLETTDCSG